MVASRLFFTSLLLSSLVACSPSNGNDGDADVATDADTDGSLDSGVDGDAESDSGAGCRANNDGIITAAESPVVLGASLLFRVNAAGSEPSVDLAGEMVDGVLTWHFDRELAGDRVIEDVIHAVASTRVADEFPDATYASTVPGYETAVGIYRVADEAVSLVGLASLEDDSTLVTYDPPVDVVRFPLEVGATWTTETSATGLVENIAFNATETYTVTVDAAGQVVVPAGTYPVLRVRTELDRSGGPLSDQRVSYAWVAECWGRVAYVGSLPGVTEQDFSEAEQVWRLTLRD